MIERDLKAYVVGGFKHSRYVNWIPRCALTLNMENADFVLFTGGEDVDPSIYFEPKGKYTVSNFERDLYEREEFVRAANLEKPMIGICRGSQLLCAMSGGRLVQHQDNPFGMHSVDTWDGESFPITSTHHQAQYPYDMPKENYKLIAWTNGMSDYHLDGKNKEMLHNGFEAEIVYYPKVKALGIQGHPEMMWGYRERYEETFDYLHNLVNLLLNNKL